MTAYYQLLRRDLTRSLPAPQWPADTRLDHYRDELAPAIHAVLRMTQEQGGGRVANLDTWRQQFISDAEFDPRLCLVASNGDGILGVAQCWTSAFIKHLSVHPCAQGQGLGRALLLHSFQVFKQRGEPMWTSRCWRATCAHASCMRVPAWCLCYATRSAKTERCWRIICFQSS